MSATVDTQILPTHIEETIQSIAKLHADQSRAATESQLRISRLTSLLGRPSSLTAITIFITLWVGLGLVLGSMHVRFFDPPPFNWLQGLVSIIALYMTILILSTQQRDDILAGHREQLTLELAILNEQKTAKIIYLLEELRRDNPAIRDRVDSEALAMSVPADPQAVFEAIKESIPEAAADAT